MSISANSKILASDVSGKIDTAGTGLTKSGTTLSLASLHSAASTIGSSSAQTLAYSGTFTIPYVTRDVYGRVSGGGTRTITMPAAPSGETAGAINNITVTAKENYTTQPVVYGGMNVTNYQNGSNSEGSPIYNSNYNLPSGGTWRWLHMNGNDRSWCGQAAGGARILNGVAMGFVFAIKVA